MFAFLIYGRHIFYAQEKKHLEEAVGIFSLFSCCPSLVNLVNIQGTGRTCGSSQSTILWRLFNSTPKAFSLSKVVVYNAKVYVDHLSMFVTPLSLFFICFISESLTLYPFVQMKLSPMRWRLHHQTAPAVSGNMGIEP